MADNVAITAGSGTTIGADDVGGVLIQRVKATWGPDGTANDADVATGKPLPVQVRSATGLIPFGEPTDAKSTATDTTSVTAISIWKQISASAQSLVTGAVLAAGAAIVGKVGIDQTTPGTTDSVTVKTQAYGAAVTQTRTADTNVYAANDVIGSATGSTAALTFAIGPSAGGQVMITGCSLETDATAVISGEEGYRLHLYNVTPPSALGDNAAWDLPSGDRASYLGYIDLGQPFDFGSTCYVEQNGVNKQITTASGNVYGYLVTLAAFTPASATVRKITLHSTAL